MRGLMITLEYVSASFGARREGLEKPLILSRFTLDSLPPFVVQLFGKAVV